MKVLFDTYYKDKPKLFIEILRENKDEAMDTIIQKLQPTVKMTQIQENIDRKTDEQIFEIMKLFKGGSNAYH